MKREKRYAVKKGEWYAAFPFKTNQNHSTRSSSSAGKTPLKNELAKIRADKYGNLTVGK